MACVDPATATLCRSSWQSRHSAIISNSKAHGCALRAAKPNGMSERNVEHVRMTSLPRWRTADAFPGPAVLDVSRKVTMMRR